MIKVEFTPGEAVRAAASIATSIDKMRQFCRDKDAEFGTMNNIYRDAIEDQKSSHAKLLVALREAGWPMTDNDIQVDWIDERIKD